MVGWASSKAAVRSQTQTSPPACAPISETSRSRTGSVRALKTRASSSAAGSLIGSRTSGVPHSIATQQSAVLTVCIDIYLC